MRQVETTQREIERQNMIAKIEKIDRWGSQKNRLIGQIDKMDGNDR